MSTFFHAVVMGAPASGKTTIAKYIARKFDFLHLCPKEMVAYNIGGDTELGRRAKGYLNDGLPLPDDLIFDTLLDCILQLWERSWILDGYPRTVKQAKKLQRNVCVDAAVNLIVPEKKIIERAKNRWIHLPSGRVYNIQFNQPEYPGIDDLTGEDLVQLPKDRPEVVQKRLQSYEITTKPLITYYENHCSIRNFEISDQKDIKKQIEKFLAEKFCYKICGDKIRKEKCKKTDTHVKCS